MPLLPLLARFLLREWISIGAGESCSSDAAEARRRNQIGSHYSRSEVARFVSFCLSFEFSFSSFSSFSFSCSFCFLCPPFVSSKRRARTNSKIHIRSATCPELVSLANGDRPSCGELDLRAAQSLFIYPARRLDLNLDASWSFQASDESIESACARGAWQAGKASPQRGKKSNRMASEK